MRCRGFDRKNINSKILHNTPTPKITKSYLLGILHDATERKYTFRISQKSEEYIKFLSRGIEELGYSAWTYREGKTRNVYIVEFSKRLLEDVNLENLEDKRDYIRGYFDAEGSVPKDSNSRYYVYFSQKNLKDLSILQSYMFEFGLDCGRIHIPSQKVDPDYFRFYLLGESKYKFASIIGSLHPNKCNRLRMKI
ncbi:hypothetical protein A3H26_01815 [candidate division WWE3 bacterium RIFCSPLOWO2_12_FULL_36_10]|uniref:DOD-type homing endonuclease domain-containing protein n=1 Tax=candidate division WWE3 bacterium RIFCSPLOWO2_12_FULL_36_10 TaxID=1802630 RepID=A0A1F4VHE7_UNCKA|nr:MAG: hypothetical protein A3H26_01815 [candidate division WWE3 bacterium RIFCSPLOWO2_12_FULL_36_10]